MDLTLLQDRILSVLEKANVPYRLKLHTSPAFTSEDAARERGVDVKQIVKTMLLRETNGCTVVALLPGDKRVHMKKINRLLKGNFQLMPPSEVQAATGFVVGAISPLGFVAHQWEIVADPAIFENEWVDIISGDPAAGIELRSEDLKKLLSCRIEEITR